MRWRSIPTKRVDGRKHSIRVARPRLRGVGLSIRIEPPPYLHKPSVWLTIAGAKRLRDAINAALREAGEE